MKFLGTLFGTDVYRQGEEIKREWNEAGFPAEEFRRFQMMNPEISHRDQRIAMQRATYEDLLETGMVE